MQAQAELFGGQVQRVQTPQRSFEEDAMGFLIKFAGQMRGKSFSAEQVTLAAKEQGIAPADLRSWGTVFQQAARDKYIRRSEQLFQRAMGHKTLAPGWTGV